MKGVEEESGIQRGTVAERDDDARAKARELVLGGFARGRVLCAVGLLRGSPCGGVYKGVLQ